MYIVGLKFYKVVKQLSRHRTLRAARRSRKLYPDDDQIGIYKCHSDRLHCRRVKGT